MNKHTNGPWFVGRPIGSNATAIIGDGDSVICTLDGRHGSLAKADANLIAAAPEMLEALKDAVLRIQSHLWLMNCDEDFICRETETARAAIAKATGCQP